MLVNINAWTHKWMKKSLYSLKCNHTLVFKRSPRTSFCTGRIIWETLKAANWWMSNVLEVWSFALNVQPILICYPLSLYYHFKWLCVWTDLAVRVNDLVVLIILNSFTKSGESGTSTLQKTNEKKKPKKKPINYYLRGFFSSNTGKRWTIELGNSYLLNFNNEYTYGERKNR